MSFDVVILPSFVQVDTWRKRHADTQAAGLFSQTVTTFAAWIADLWELYGDGRAIIGDMQREIALQQVLSPRGDGLDAAGIVPLASNCMRAMAGVPRFESALSAAAGEGAFDGLSEREVAFAGALARYRRLIDDMGLIEPGCAAMHLASHAEEVFPAPLNVLMPESPPLPHIQSAFFEACPQLHLTVEPACGMDGIGRAPDGVSMRFAFPSGRLAEPGLVADVVMDVASGGDVAVACKDPLHVCASVSDRLSAAGLNVCVQARKPFAQTDFGKAFLAMFSCLHADPWNPSELSDVVLSPFSGFTQADALKVDASLRADRIADRDEVLAALRSASEPFSQLEELASDPEADVLIGMFEQAVQSSAHRSAAWRAEQLSAMGALRDATSAARRVNAGIDACARVLRRATVAVSARIAGEGPTVLFTTQAIAARLGVGAFASLVLADLTSEDYPVADKDDAAATFFAKIGLQPEEGALSRARRQFCALLDVASSNLVVMRPLSDANADDTYPSVVLEEFIDAYRPDASATEDIDNPYRLPADLQAGLVERGEELLFANANSLEKGARQPMGESAPQPDPYQIEGVDRLSSPVAGDAARNEFSQSRFSPSQIEAYLECPYQWFASRKLRIGQLDEGFGPLERGTFAHAALEAFYRGFQEAGFAKVSDDNLAEARALMQSIVDDLARAQFDEDPGSGRLVYATELERRDVIALGNQLIAFLNVEARLLPTYHPAYFEYEINADSGIEYAGFPLVGKVDRIDVDDRGHAVIVDYKGSVNDEHEIAGKTADHAGKVQTRIYARAVEKALGLEVAGALYVSYGNKRGVCGAYDPRVLDAAHLPFMRHDKCACGLAQDWPDDPEADRNFADLAFDVMLDETERVAGEAIARMQAGDVRPNPAFHKVCEYCPVLVCPKRGA